MKGMYRRLKKWEVQQKSQPLGQPRPPVICATFVYSGTIEPLYVLGQQVQAGEVIFRLTRDTGRFDTLGSTPIPGEVTSKR